MIKHISLTIGQKDRPDRTTRMVFHSHDDPPTICEVIYSVGNGRLFSTRRERMVEMCPCNTYICIVCAINNHQMDNLEGTSKNIITIPYSDHFVATSIDDQVDLPLPKSMSLLIVRGSVVWGHLIHLHDVSPCSLSVEISRTRARIKRLWQAFHSNHQGWCVSQHLLIQLGGYVY